MLDKKTKKTKIFIAIIALALIVGIVISIFLIMNSKTYQVNFYSDSETIIKVDEVKRNDSAIPPNNPQITYGKIFKAWDKDFTKVTKNMDVHPICEDITKKENVFAVSGVYGKTDSDINIPVFLGGNVCLCGFDITVTYNPQMLNYEGYTDEDGAIVVNSKEQGTIKVNYISTKNTTGDINICNLKFTAKDKNFSGPIKLKVNSIYAFEDSEDLKNDNMYSPKYNTIDGEVFVLP